MRRSIVSTLLIGSAAALLYRRFRRPGNSFERMTGKRRLGRMGLTRWMRNIRLNMNVGRVISMVFGRKLLRRLAR